MVKVYLAGPYTLGDTEHNVRQAIAFGEHLSALGYIPYIPHLNHYWDAQHPHDPEFWYEYDNHWLDCCDCLLRIPGESIGADREMHRMIDQSKPVFLDIESLEAWYKEKGAAAPADAVT